jgi:hypothetical protein
MVEKGEGMKFKLLKISRLDSGFEKLEYFDKEFYKRFVTKDDWWNLEYLPADHDSFDLKLFINQLQAYSEENNNPPVVAFEMSIRPIKLQETPFVQTHEDCRTLKHMDEIVEWLYRILNMYHTNYKCPGFVYNATFICRVGKANAKRKRTRIPRGMRHEVFKRDNYTCVECGAKKEDGATLHVDHKIPVSKGGTDELDNLQTLCSDCNLNKSDVIQ